MKRKNSDPADSNIPPTPDPFTGAVQFPRFMYRTHSDGEKTQNRGCLQTHQSPRLPDGRHPVLEIRLFTTPTPPKIDSRMFMIDRLVFFKVKVLKPAPHVRLHRAGHVLCIGGCMGGPLAIAIPYGLTCWLANPLGSCIPLRNCPMPCAWPTGQSLWPIKRVRRLRISS